MNTLAEKVAVVTGGGGGIGRAAALELARHGAAVVVNDLGTSVAGDGSDTAVAEEVAKEINAAGGRAVPHTEDVADWQGSNSLVQAALENFGRIDIAVNAAGIIRDKMIFNLTEDDWDSVLRVHLKHSFAVTRHTCAHWRKQAKEGNPVSGRIVNLTSASGLLGNPGQANYGSAKAAIAAFTVITAREMSRYGVTANAVAPLARTRMTAQLSQLDDGARDVSGDPYDPQHIARFVTWLASDDSHWVTGQVFRVEGELIGIYSGWALKAQVRHTSAPEVPADVGMAVRQLFGACPPPLPMG